VASERGRGPCAVGRRTPPSPRQPANQLSGSSSSSGSPSTSSWTAATLVSARSLSCAEMPSIRRTVATAPVTHTETFGFKARGRLLLLLGDQLIRDAGVAVFELVKNGYDADASRVVVRLENVTDVRHGRIVVEDDGTGMDWATVTQVWLEPGTDNRQRQRDQGERSPIHHRLPLGEKGVGRFAAHKLGRQIEMVTRERGGPEIAVAIDWDEMSRVKYLADVEVRDGASAEGVPS
jgi:anti-sigma regulatory factor (Ser/Thr protein kinase)